MKSHNILLPILAVIILASCDGNWQQNSTDHSNHNHNHEKSVHVPHDSIVGLYVDETPVKPEYHQPLTEPDWRDTYDHMKPDDFVIGIKVNDVPYAIPWWILKNHHIAIISIEDVPVVATLCEMCSGGNVLSRVIGSDTLTFIREGIYKASWFMKDHQTGSYWLPFEGRSFHGSLRGRLLDVLPSYQLYWHEWLEENPDTYVLWGEQKMREGHGSKHAPGYDVVEDIFANSIIQDIPDDIPKHNLVLGVGSQGSWKAYNIEDLEKVGSVLEDKLPDGSDALVLSEPGTSFCGAYKPIWSDTNLKFQVNDVGNIIDLETGSIWNVFGECISGELEGAQLEAFPFFVKEWYGWFTYHPETEIYKVP